jgi:hypothetical protein
VSPSTPQITNIDYGDSKAYISVSVADSGSSSITGYTATCTDGATEYTGTSTTPRITVSGLTNGVIYSCSVTATSAAGTSTASTPSPPFTPAIQPDAPIINLSLGEPINGEIHSGIGNLRGWAIAENGIDRVEIFIDGKYMYDAPYGGLRVDVEASFPNVDGSLLSGYSLAFGYADLGSGQHTVRAVAYDSLGNSTEQSSTFNVVVYDKNFIDSNEVVDLSGSTLSASGDEIMINGASIGQQGYNLKLKWRTAEQGFEVIEIQ